MLRFLGWGAAVALTLGALAGCEDARDVEGFAATSEQGVCANCHSAPDEGPPFRRTNGVIEDPPGGGAHERHIAGAGVTVPIKCSECHVVPDTVGQPGHINGVPAVVFFGPLARTGGIDPPTCGATYCHGNFPGGNAANVPAWFAAKADACGTCHPVPATSVKHDEHIGKPYGTGPEPRPVVGCNDCHGPILKTTHVNGVKDVGPTPRLQAYDRATKTCATDCHPGGGASWFE